MTAPTPARIIVKPSSGPAVSVKVQLETEKLVASILDDKPTPALYAKYLAGMLDKLADESTEPYLVDVELALLGDLIASVESVDFARLEAARDAWTEAFSKLLPAAQKGCAMLTRALRAMFTAVTQVEFEKRVSALIEGIPEQERVASLEFAEELMTSLLEFTESDKDGWNPDEVNYIDNHIYFQLFRDIVRPSIEVRGKALVTRRLGILLKLIQTFQF